MRNRKRRMENFTFYDYREICTHLEQMVQNGWMLKRIGLFWEYERIEPARLHFAVSHCRGIKEEIEEKDGGWLEAGLPVGPYGNLLLQPGGGASFW